ncbi:shikimate kinase [Orenia metallireducens]|jgi:shikimate kinase|uniref:Shikimate kinase n=1 Tax=Orenia metallireducens TaxID=1413210 RepID=A0A285I5U7_9FIRM|nr:shikimate kinase [Orenia metallireducens]PRX19730.1 shikimate kinase [Orenia metallireducens]SNY43207.1 shikimate kinase [Orenia metallireducens]
MNIALIGFMGTGKTTVAKLLAEILDYCLVDIDEEIVKVEGRSIPDIFAEEGEEYFRDVESKVTLNISQGDKQVISTGGGVVLREENIDNLKSNGIVVLLRATAETIFQRVKDEGGRPLLEVADPLAKIKSMLAERADKYNCTEYQIDTDQLSAEEVVEQILKAVKSEE